MQLRDVSIIINKWQSLKCESITVNWYNLSFPGKESIQQNQHSKNIQKTSSQVKWWSNIAWSLYPLLHFLDFFLGTLHKQEPTNELIGAYQFEIIFWYHQGLTLQFK